MRRYKVLLQGENFLFNIDGEHRFFGFQATRIVKAASLESAKKIALICLHHELNACDLKFVEGPKPPRLQIKEIRALGKLQLVRRKTVTGFDFYYEDEQAKAISTAIND